MRFSTATLSNTSPVCTDTILMATVTWSTLYCLVTPMPRYLAPAPPVSMLLSYPTTPPSTISPANSMGFRLGCLSPSYTSRVDLINCRSLTKFSNPILSTTLNHLPPLARFSASMTQTSEPCDTALLSCEKLALGFLCPVLSVKLYTAIVMMGPSSSGRCLSFCSMCDPATTGSSHLTFLIVGAQPDTMSAITAAMVM